MRPHKMNKAVRLYCELTETECQDYHEWADVAWHIERYVCNDRYIDKLTVEESAVRLFIESTDEEGE